MIERKATASWEGTLEDGYGVMSAGPELTAQKFSFDSRFGDAKGLNPEEMIGAALAGCFSMALTKTIQEGGHQPEKIETFAEVSLDDSEPRIASIKLKTNGKVPGLAEDKFRYMAEQTGKSCPVAKALSGVEITVEPTMLAAASG